jgi:N-methylhydantoinase A
VEATLSDANLTLGYLDAGFFLGGKMDLDPAAGAAAIERATGELDLDLMRAAWGIHDIANEDICRAFRMHATERGFDYRLSGMAAFGGGGPVHAARIARKLMVPKVIFPADAGVMSAFGMLAGAMSFEIMRSHRANLAGLDQTSFQAVLAPIEAEASAYLRQAGIAPEDIRLDRRLDMRYAGQGYDIEVALPADLPPDRLLDALPELFASSYKAIFDTTLDQPMEIVSWKVEALGPEPEFHYMTGDGDWSQGTERALKGHRRAFFPRAGGLIDCPVYDRYRLATGAILRGPCLIEERESTVLLDQDDEGRVDAAGNIMTEIAVA